MKNALNPFSPTWYRLAIYFWWNRQSAWGLRGYSYLLRRSKDGEEEEFFEKQRELNEPSELYLTALREYNVRELLLKRLTRQKSFRDMKMGEYLDILNELVDAKDYDDVNEIIRRISKR